MKIDINQRELKLIKLLIENFTVSENSEDAKNLINKILTLNQIGCDACNQFSSQYNCVGNLSICELCLKNTYHYKILENELKSLKEDKEEMRNRMINLILESEGL